MPDQVRLNLTYILLASCAGLTGGLAAYFWNPDVAARSAIQHFAAGSVIAAVATSVIPEVERLGTIPGILAGFGIGGLAMMGLKWLVVKYERRAESRHILPVGLAVAAAVDTFLDGVIIAAGFNTAQRIGALLAAALAIELFFLTLAVGSEFRKIKSRRWQGFAVTTGISALLILGAIGADFFLADASDVMLTFALAFGAAALIYLVAEELLVEAFQAEKSIFSTAMLFTGFLVILASDLLSR